MKNKSTKTKGGRRTLTSAFLNHECFCLCFAYMSTLAAACGNLQGKPECSTPDPTRIISKVKLSKGTHTFFQRNLQVPCQKWSLSFAFFDYMPLKFIFGPTIIIFKVKITIKN